MFMDPFGKFPEWLQFFVKLWFSFEKFSEFTSLDLTACDIRNDLIRW